MAPLFVLFPSPFLAVYFAWDFTTAACSAHCRACKLVGFTAAFFFASSVLMATYSSTWYCSYIILYRPSFNLQQQQHITVESEQVSTYILHISTRFSVTRQGFSQHWGCQVPPSSELRLAWQLSKLQFPPIIGLAALSCTPHSAQFTNGNHYSVLNQQVLESFKTIFWLTFNIPLTFKNRNMYII